METLNDFLNSAVNWGLNAKLVLAVIVTGYLVKPVPQIPNYLIPWFTLVVAVMGNVLLGDPGTISPSTRYPDVQLGLNGLIPWGAGWLLHNQGLSRLEHFLPAPLKALLGTKADSKEEPKP